MSTAIGQLPRLLALVPYLLSRPGVQLSVVADTFGISEDRLRKDLNLLWVCGLPGHGPGDLIDVEFEGDTVTLLEPAGVTRPLRLTVDEALALIVALRALADTPGLSERVAVHKSSVRLRADVKTMIFWSLLNVAELSALVELSSTTNTGGVQAAVRTRRVEIMMSATPSVFWRSDARVMVNPSPLISGVDSALGLLSSATGMAADHGKSTAGRIRCRMSSPDGPL